MSNLNSEPKLPYFPPPFGPVECGKCDLSDTCLSCDRFQRSRRDFTVTSGRCPRLPNWSGFMDPEQQALYEQFFPVVHATRCGDKLDLLLRLPGEKRQRRVYRKVGYWYFRDRLECGPVKRILTIHGGSDRQEILRQIEFSCTSSGLFRCTVEDQFL